MTLPGGKHVKYEHMFKLDAYGWLKVLKFNLITTLFPFQIIGNIKSNCQKIRRKLFLLS